MQTVAELRQELDTLPTLIAQTAQAGNTVALRKLKARALEIPEEIDQAALDATRAELAELDARRAALRPAFDEARAELAELQSQRATIDAAIGAAEQRLHVVTAKLGSLGNQREQLQMLATAQQRENARRWAGQPLGLNGTAQEEHFRMLHPLIAALPDGAKGGEVQAQRPDWADNRPAWQSRP